MAIRATRPGPARAQAGPGTNGLGSAQHERAHWPCRAVRRATSSTQARAHGLISCHAGPVRHGDFGVPVPAEARASREASHLPLPPSRAAASSCVVPRSSRASAAALLTLPAGHYACRRRGLRCVAAALLRMGHHACDAAHRPPRRCGLLRRRRSPRAATASCS